MSRLSPAFVLGYHGCEYEIAKAIFSGDADLKMSKNGYDWLGSGVYFWEADADRAQKWAEEKAKRKEIDNPVTVGAIIDLRRCLNVSTIEGVDLLKKGYEIYKKLRDREGQPLAQNTDPSKAGIKDKLIRRLDYAVIEQVHQIIEQVQTEPFDTVRGMFQEGKPAYPGAGILEKTHTQIAVRNKNCIVGYFRPRKIKA